MNNLDDRIIITNDILNKLGSNLKVDNITKIDTKLFLLIYRLLFDNIPNGIDENDGNNLKNMTTLLEHLSRNVLHVSLSHINIKGLVKGEKIAVSNLLEIFQGLVDCKKVKYMSRETKDNMEGLESIVDCKKVVYNGNGSGDNETRKLRRNIRDTEMQTDNFELMIKNMSETRENMEEREVYLRRKMVELLERRGCPVKLSEYVEDEHDRIILLKDKYKKKNNANDQVRKNTDRNTRRKSERQIECTNNKGDAPNTENKRRPENEDELTIVTGRDCPELKSDSNSELSHGSSQDTYVLSSPKVNNVLDVMDLKENCEVREEWMKVNKDLLHDGYENEFLEMLLREEGFCNEKKSDVVKKSTVGSMTEDDDGGGSLSAFNDDMTTRNITPRRKKMMTSRSCGGGGLVKSVVKNIGHHSYRKDCLPLSSRSDRSHINNDGEEQNEMMVHLLSQFPGLNVSEHSLRQMWAQASRQAANIHQIHREFTSRLGPGEQRIEDARRRQQLLFSLLRKEALHQARLRERTEERESQFSLKASKEKQRQQSAKARRYYEEFSQRMKSRMIQKQAREEQVFRDTFKAALKLQRERINDLRRYTKEKKNEKYSQHQRELDSLENYYRDRFSMLADCLKGEREQLSIQDKSHELALEKRKREIRKSMERDIRQLQESMVRSEHEKYFRELDGTDFISPRFVNEKLPF